MMIEAVTAILGLFCAAIFLAHAVDAYRALSAQEFGARRATQAILNAGSKPSSRTAFAIATAPSSSAML